MERLERQLAAGGTQVTSTAGRRQAPSAGRDPAAAGPGTGPASDPLARGTEPPTSAPAAPSSGTSPSPGGGAGQPAAGERRQPQAGRDSPAVVDTDMLRSRWTDVLDAVREVRKTAWILLSSYASIEAVEGNVLTVAFDTEGNAKGFASSGSDSYLADVLQAMFGARLVIRTIVGPGPGRRRRPGRASGTGRRHWRRSGRSGRSGQPASPAVPAVQAVPAAPAVARGAEPGQAPTLAVTAARQRARPAPARRPRPGPR